VSVPLLVLAPNAWDGPWMNRQQLFSRLGRDRRVLYSNGAWTTRDLWRPRWRSASARGGWVSQDNVAVDVPPRMCIRQQRVRRLDRFVITFIANRWRTAAKDHNGRFIAYLFHPRFAEYVESLAPDFLVYHAYDLYERQRGWTEHLAKAQTDLVRRADLVLASSNVIADVLSQETSLPVHTLPNGADVNAFFAAAVSTNEPPLLSQIPRPRIGYTGHLNRKVDFALIETLATRHPEWHFVLIGAVKDGTDLRGTRGFRNIHWLGQQHRDVVPNLVAAMDANLICNDLSDELWVKGCYPLKLHEYLAVGLPIVSADIPAVRQFADVVAIARSAEQWEHAIQASLAGEGVGSAVERKKTAAQNSWDARVVELSRLLDQMVSARPAGHPVSILDRAISGVADSAGRS
jgi:glycosyltransferase involved in cell wall biosynthesis